MTTANLIKLVIDAAYMGFFAAAAWAGHLLAVWLLTGEQPFDDGPTPGRVNIPTLAGAAALIGLGVALRSSNILDSLVSVLVVVALAACVSSDVRLGILPDVFTLGPLAIVVIAAAVEHTWAPGVWAALIAMPFAIAALITKGRGLGWGDVKLAALAGAIGGFIVANVLLALVCLAGAIIGRVRSPGRPFALGPYIAAAVGIAVATVNFL